MKKLFVFSLILFVFAPQFYAQQSDEVLKEVFLDGEFFLYEEEYADALPSYQRLYNRGYEDNANINYRIGICYLNMPGEKHKSIPFLQKAVQKVSSSYKEGVFKQNVAPYDAYIFLGNAYRINNQLDSAIASYNKFRGLVDEKNVAEIAYANTQIISCQNAQKLMKSPLNLKFTNLGETINSSSSNFQPVFSANEDAILYMNELPFYDAVYYSKIKNGKWTKPRNITPEIQSDGDQYTSSLSFDGQTLLLSRTDNFDSDIWFSTLEKNQRWTKSEPFGKPINSKYWESHACLTADGQKIFFTSNRKGGIGEMDIYYSEVDDKGKWGDPINLGPQINTVLNEDIPYITEDGKTLYFSSQGHYNMGGYDVFYVTLQDDGTWSEPTNLGYPLNTTDDDLYYVPAKNGEYGYVARFEEGNYGKEDIYKVEIMEGEPEPELTEKPMITETKEAADTLLAAVEDAETKTELDNVIEKPEEVAPTELRDKVEPDKPATEPAVEETIEIIEIKPIFYDFNSVSLTETAKESLDYLITVLDENSSTFVQLIGHTDARGSVDINKIISLNRAKAAREYLIRNGVSPYRIKVFGMGKSSFLALNENPDGSDNPEGRQYNRRVEIKINNIDTNIKVIEKIQIPEHLKIQH